MKKAVVAGHICIDITPTIPGERISRIDDMLSPGKLVNVDKADIHTGGAVSNTGLAMKKLGADVVLAGVIGNDAFGDLVYSIVSEYNAETGLIRKEGESTSYSIVIAPPGIDRIFLHNPGANNTFSFEDVPMDIVSESALFHFGYPPIMRRMFENNGAELVKIMKSVKESGVATSMDLAAIDPNSDAGKADWKTILSDTLPYVDIFVPSAEELMYMIDRENYGRLQKKCDGETLLDIESDIKPLAKRCIDMGAGIVLIKCGEPGMYYLTAGSERLEKIGCKLELDINTWKNKCGFEKSYVPDRVLSGTGAGDTSVAAFLTAMLDGMTPDWCVKLAAAEGASCVAEYDALSGIKTLDELQYRIEKGWKKV